MFELITVACFPSSFHQNVHPCLMGLVDSHADSPGAGQTRGGQASSGERLAIRVVRREQSLISMVRNTLRMGQSF